MSADDLELRVSAVRSRMRPLEQQLGELRAERDVLLTEVRRRQRLAHRERRAGLRDRMRSGDLPTIVDLVAAGDSGSFSEYRYHLKTGGEVGLGFPGSQPSIALTNGRQVVQARDLARATELYQAGWELGSPGRSGVRVHFPGTRQEKLVEAEELFAQPREREP